MPLSGYDPHIASIYMGDGGLAFINRLDTEIQAAGWTRVTRMPVRRYLRTYGYNLAAGQRITINYQDYYARTSVGTTANEFLIGATDSETKYNLKYCVEANPLYSGIKFGSSTVANTKCRIPDQNALVSGDTYLYAVATEDLNNQAAFQYTESSYWNWGTDSREGAGYAYKSGTTPDGNRVYFTTHEWSDANYYSGLILRDAWDHGMEKTLPGLEDETPYLGLPAFYAATPDTNIQFWGTPYALAWYNPGDFSTASNYGQVFVSKLNPELASLIITGATDASPIEITTAADHGWSTNDEVAIVGCIGNTAPNMEASWTITVTGTDTFTLNSSTGNGTYTGGGRVGGPKRDVVSGFAYADNGLRNRWDGGGETYTWHNTWMGLDDYSMKYMDPNGSGTTGERFNAYGAKDLVYPALAAFGNRGDGTTEWYTGWIYDALIMAETQSVENNEWTDADGNTWFRWSVRDGGIRTMWLLKEKAAP